MVTHSKTIVWCLLLTLFTSLATTSQAQNDGIEDIYISVKMNDGNTFVGKQIALTDTHIIIETESLGKMNLPRENVKIFKVINKPIRSTSGQYWYENPNATRNVITPTGYSLRKGEGYYQNLMLFYNQVSYGFTDRLTIGAGIETLSLLGRESNENSLGYTITPKFSFPIHEEKLNIGVGALLINFPFRNDDQLLDLATLYGVSTFGSRDRNFSLGVGFGVVDGEFSSRPTVTISGNFRISERFALTSENWILPNSDGIIILSFGGRIIGNNITWDISFFGATDVDGGGFFDILPIPLVGLVAPFGGSW
jgi:hypothetical protein